MTDKDVEREIEKNQERVRDKKDVGLDEDVLQKRDQEDNDTILDDISDAFTGVGDDNRQRDVEYKDDETS